MSLYQYAVTLDQVPFETDTHKNILRELDEKLGGLKVYYQPPSKEQAYHMLRLNIAARHSEDSFISIGTGADRETADAAFKMILNNLYECCSKNDLPLVVMNEESHAFRVAGDLENGLVFRRLSSPAKAPSANPSPG